MFRVADVNKAGRSRAVWAAVLSATVAGAGLLVAPASAVAADAPVPCVVEQGDEAAAGAMARRCDIRVLISGATTETTQTWALPTGELQEEISTAPVRVRRDGGWVPLDLTLSEQPDGSIAPNAHPGSLRIAGHNAAGGLTELATLGADGAQVAMGWQGDLPEPALAGSRATYADVKPGVDLVVEATPRGVESFYVVRNRDAADSVENLTVPIAGQAVAEHRLAKDGTLTLLDDADKVVAASPTPLMWDAKVDPLTGQPANIRRIATRASERTATDSAQGADAIDGAGVDLALKPDTTFLNDPHTTYPVTIDPAVTLTSPYFDTWIRDGLTTDQSTSTALAIGYTSSGVSRSLITWDTARLRAKRIKVATTTLYNYKSSSCNLVGWQVWTLTGAVNSATRWANQPTWVKADGGSQQTKAGPSDCAPAGAPGTVSINSKAFFQNAAEKNIFAAQMGVRATDESDPAGYKAFYSDNYSDTTKAPKTVITYDSYPKVDSASTSPGTTCTTGNGRPAISTTQTPIQLRAVISDEDADVEPATKASADFEWKLNNVRVNGARTALAPSGTTHTTTIPAADLQDGKVYSWSVRGYYKDGDDDVYTPQTDPPAACEFMVDLSPPNVTGSSEFYSSTTWSSSTTSTVTLTANDDTANGAGSGIKGWAISTDQSESNKAPGTITHQVAAPTITVTPALLQDGVNWVHAAAIDNAGNRTEYKFQILFDGTKPGPATDITSSTHPDPTVSYPSREVLLTWKAPVEGPKQSGIAEWAYALDQSQGTTPTGAQTTKSPDPPTRIVIPGSQAGTWYFHLRAKDDAGNWSEQTAHFAIKLLANPLTIIGSAMGGQNSTTGVAVSSTLTTSDGTAPFTWSATGLPANLIMSSDGVISGTPTTAGTSSVAVSVRDANGRTGAKTFTWVVAPPLTANRPAAQQATVGTPTTLSLTAAGGSAPYRWAATGLPGWLTLDAATGVITGTPVTASSVTATVTVTDAAGRTASVPVDWVVTVPVTVGDPGPQSLTIGAATTLALQAGGGAAPYTWMVDQLPDGLTLDAGQGVVSGAATTAGTVASTVTVTDSVGRTARASITWNTTGVPAGVTATAADAQTVNLSWQDVRGASGYKIYRDGDLVATAPPSAPVNGVRFADRQLEGSTSYRYQVSATAGNNLEGARSSAATAATSALPATAYDYARCDKAAGAPGCLYTSTVSAAADHSDSGTALTDGVHGQAQDSTAWQGRNKAGSYAFVVDLGSVRPVAELNSSWLQIQSGAVQLPNTVTYATSADGRTYTPMAAIARPAVSSADQVKTYRAINVGKAARYVKVSVDGGTAWSMIDEIEVRGNAARFTIAEPAQQASTVDTVVSRAMTGTGGTGPYTWSATDLPTGLSINPASGVISGKPTEAGTWVPTVTATDADKVPAGTVAFTWKIGTPVALNLPPVLTSALNTPISQQMASWMGSGTGTGGYKWSATGLPSGLSIDAATGLVSGTPTTLGSFSTQITMTDSASSSATGTATWSVLQELVCEVPEDVTWKRGQPVSLQLAASGGQGSYKWALYSWESWRVPLPAGLELDTATGLISGTPRNVEESNTITVFLTDGTRSVLKTLRWRVVDPVEVTVPDGDSRIDVEGDHILLQPTAKAGAAPYLWTATDLPTGLTIDANTGAISGTHAPVEPNQYGSGRWAEAIITATDAAGQIGQIKISWLVESLLSPQNPGVATPGTVGVQTMGRHDQAHIVKVIDVTANSVVVTCSPAGERTWRTTGSPEPDHTGCVGFLSYKATGSHQFRATLARPDGTDTLDSVEWTHVFTATAPTQSTIASATVGYTTAGAADMVEVAASTPEPINAGP
ncbi:putative Ig domain-containing protein [Actinoplanes sp. NPDC089786]|uniref:putative Ig domain-containing protein n=1 Tax=Actinoplanes sp. NPDC089786 TaxID=3155185 RepID=UPI00341F13C1